MCTCTVQALRAPGAIQTAIRDPRFDWPFGGGACRIFLFSVLAVAGCDRLPFQDQAGGVTVRDSAGIRIVENHAPMWDSAEFWTLESEPVFGIGSGGGASDATNDVSHLVWDIKEAAPLSDGRVAMLSSSGENKVLIFEPSGELSASFGRKGRGPGEFTYALHLQVLPGDTIVVWDYMFGPIGYFDPSGTLLKDRRIDFGAMIEEATPGSGQALTEAVALPLPDGSFLAEVVRLDWQPPKEGLYQPPVRYLRIDLTYSAHSFGWWDGVETLAIPPPAPPIVPFATRSIITGGGDPMLVYVAPHDRYEIHQFSENGVLRRIIRRDVDPIPITSQELEEWIESVSARNPHWEWTAWKRAMATLPRRFHRVVRTFRVDSKGYLWSMDKREASTSEWSVFNPDGRWLGTLAMPSGRITWIGDIVIVVRTEPVTGLETVEGYRLNRRAGRR